MFDFSNKKFVCPICKKEFDSREELVSHEDTHKKRERIRKYRKDIEGIWAKKEIRVPKKRWIKTGIPGFDDIFENGIPVGNAVLVCGGPGSGKTIFCLQLCNHAARHGKKCAYITFEETEDDLRSHMLDFGWDPLELEKKGTLLIREINPFLVKRLVEARMEYMEEKLLIEFLPILFTERYTPEIVVIDSLSAIAAFFEKKENYRMYIHQLIQYFKKLGVTSFLISETEDPAKWSRSGVEDFLADGIVVLFHKMVGNTFVRAIGVIKMRGTKFSEFVFPMRITKKGIVVFAEEALPEGFF